MTIFSTDMTIGGILLRAGFILSFIGFVWLKYACDKAPVYKDDDMKMGFIFLFIPKGMLVIIPMAATLVIITILLGLSNWAKVKEHFRTGYNIERKLNK